MAHEVWTDAEAFLKEAQMIDPNRLTAIRGFATQRKDACALALLDEKIAALKSQKAGSTGDKKPPADTQREPS